MNTIEAIMQHKLVAIVRRVAPKDILATAKALYEGGIRLLEVTFDQASPTCVAEVVESLERLKPMRDLGMRIGTGTTLTIEQVEAAKQAEAEFVLAPDTNIEVIKATKDAGMVAIPGAFTPSEIMSAWNAGADIVKLFPAANLGIPYFKAIRGPISHVPLMAVGGVDEKNVKQFLDAGFNSCGIGSNLVRRDLIEAGKFDELTKIASTFIEALGAQGR
jgi:2-dehydro-3-deoxyphosphogluconate aldolase/(4S)-4-hydroxy-2-oxoglutarate aldolase